ncbi:MAG: hypothetical protein GQ570_00400 [Helicobacteraceae bacterium]|nr:hypothetical protein [Helicobacteraceae bacterium]
MNSKFLSFLTLNKQHLTGRTLYLFVLVAFLVALAIKLSLYYMVKDDQSLYYAGELLSIWSDDAAHYGDIAKKIIVGESIQINHNLTAYLVAYTTMYSPFSVEQVMLFLPAVVSSLVVIPIVLAFNSLRLFWLGFFNALLLSSVLGFYIRTHLGYADTDMLIILFLATLSSSIIIKLRTKNILNDAIITLSIFLLLLTYHAGIYLIVPIVGLLVLFALFEKKYEYFDSLILVAFGMLLYKLINYNVFINISAWLGFILYILNSKLLTKIDLKVLKIVTLVTGLLFASLNYTNIETKIRSYTDATLDKKVTATMKDGKEIYLMNAQATVQESKILDYKATLKFLNNYEYIFYISFIGSLLLSIRYKHLNFLLIWIYLSIAGTFLGGLRFALFGGYSY